MTPRVSTTVTTTYLHLPSRETFRPTVLDDPDLLVMQVREPSVPYYRFLYDAVGRAYHWVDRLGWSDDTLHDHLARPSTTLLVLYVRGAPAGFCELEASGAPDGTEIVYFGLLPAFHGRGLGKHLLSVGVTRAFDDGAPRVWLHTCTLDGVHALANYTARGFAPYKTTLDQQMLNAEVPTPSLIDPPVPQE